jgi:hypothetical protein
MSTIIPRFVSILTLLVLNSIMLTAISSSYESYYAVALTYLYVLFGEKPLIKYISRRLEE